MLKNRRSETHSRIGFVHSALRVVAITTLASIVPVSALSPPVRADSVGVGSQTSPDAVGVWTLDEGSGTAATDSAQGLVATLAPGATWISGRFGSGVKLDGASGYIGAPIIDVPGSALTLSSWVNISDLQSDGDQTFISKATGTSEQAHYWTLGHVRTKRQDRLQFRLKAGKRTMTLVASSGNLPAGTWFHAAATYDGTYMRLFLNGTEIGRARKSGAIATNASVPVDFGRSPDGSNYLTGAIDEVRIYARALDAEEIVGIMNGPGADVTPPSVPTGVSGAALSPTEISLQWTASTDNTGVAGYRIFRNGSAVGTAAATSFADKGLTSSTTYQYGVAAYDAAGNQSPASPPVSVTTAPATPNEPPTVQLTSPVAGATFTAPATIALTASASDAEGRLQSVQFFSGTTLLGTDMEAPYGFTWTSVPAGSYSFKAVARDADGGVSTSPVVAITVTAPAPVPWLVAFTASVDHHSLVTSYWLQVFAAGADPNTATPVATSDLGKPAPDANGEIRVDRTAFFEALATGGYVVTVSAVGAGGSSRSEPFAFTR